MPTYRNYAVIGEPRIDFDTDIDFYLGKDTSGDSANIRAYYPDRIVTKSAQDNFLSIPNIRFYELTDDEASTLAGTSSIKEVPRFFSQEETVLKYEVSSSISFSQSLDLFFKSGSAFPDFYSLTRMEDYYEPDFTGSITSSRLPLNAFFYSESQEAFWYNGGEEIFANSSSYSQSFLDRFTEASMSWDLTTGSTPRIDGLNAIGIEIDGLLTPWYLEQEPAYDDINGVQTPFGGGGLGFYNICPTVNLRWRGGGSDNQTSYYAGSWPGSQLDTDGQMVNWGLYAHSTPKEEFDWRVIYQLNTDSASIDAYGNFPLKSTSVPYNFTATGKNVDLIIIDTGVNTQHPEFKYYNPNGGVSGSGAWESRVIKTDWRDYCPEIVNNIAYYGVPSAFWLNTYYDNMNFEHGTSVASNAAGRTQGWAKEARIHDLNIFGGKCQPAQAMQCVLNFHVSKSINPTTGFKDPTVVNMSWGYVITPIDHSQFYDENGKLTRFSNPTEIDSFYYKGVNLYPDYTGSENEDGDLVYNLTPGHDQGIRFRISESFDPGFGDSFERKIMKVYTSAYNGVVEELIQQCVDAGVIFLTSAGNDASLRVKSGSKYEGVDYDHRGLWDSYFTKNGSSLTYYTNRASTPGRNNAVITVGALAPHIVIDRGTDLLTGSLLTSGSSAYDVYGERAGCNWVFGGAGSTNLIQRRGVPEFEHSDMHEIMGTSNRAAKRGAGVGDTFPGWEAANSSSYFPAVWFSTVGNAVDIWAAGHNVPVARADLDQIVAEATGFGWRPTKHANASLAHYQIPFQVGYYFLGNTNYSNYYNLYPQPSPPSRITQQKYRTSSGTSFASPNAAGVVCLFMELNPGATWSQVKKFLIEQGQKAMPVWVDNPSQNHVDFTGSMKSDFALASGNYGYGKLSPVVDDDSMAPSMNRDIAICGAEPVMLYWPYTQRKTQFNNINITNG